jgi:DNA-directed RNA polymerase II subunit RPB1
LSRSDRHVQNAPLPPTPPVQQQIHYAPAVGYYREERGRCDDSFAAQPSRSVVHQSPYDGQPAYAYPPNVGPYGYNNPHGYPPQAHYPPQPQIVAQSQQYDTALPSDSSLPYARQYDAIPSPAHNARSETSLLHHPEPETPSIAIARDAVSTVQDRHSIEDDEDVPPPAYEITETFVNHRSDVKTRPLAYDAASTISASGSTAAPASVSTSAGPSTEPPSPFHSSAGPSAEPPSPFYSSAGPSTEPLSPFYSSAGPSTEPPSPFHPSAGTSADLLSPLILSPSRHHTLSSRPVSGTSAVTIVYE